MTEKDDENIDKEVARRSASPEYREPKVETRPAIPEFIRKPVGPYDAEIGKELERRHRKRGW